MDLRQFEHFLMVIELGNFVRAARQLQRIQKYNLNTNGLINFFKNLPDQKNHYFQSHPRPQERINILDRYSSDNKNNNSIIF